MNARRVSICIAFTLLASSATLCLLFAQHSLRAAPPNSPQQVTFNRDVAPILFEYCAPCHRPGEAAPFSLLTYEDAAKFAKQIQYVTQHRIMPPWLPASGEFRFQGELRLSEEHIAILRQWAEQGAPRGKAEDLPPAPKFVPGWQLGKPDLILHAAKPYTLPAAGADNYWNFIFPTQLSGQRWIKAIEIRPGEKRVVHHANIYVDRLHSSRALERHPGEGFPGMELRIESESFDPDSHLFFWKPGALPHEEPPGRALRLDPGDDFVLNVHMQPSGKPETILPTIGIYFTDQPASQFPILLELQNDAALDIPPGVPGFLVEDSFTLPADVDLLAIYPHAHYLGKELRATATLPSGDAHELIAIPDWDLNWQGVFYYEHPIALPKGTVISMRYTYDNSDANPRNPFRPPRPIRGGNQTTDEMAHLWLQVLAHGSPVEQEEARRTLQEAQARHDIARDPQDFAAHYNLAAMLQSRGDTPQALEHFQIAASLRPRDPIAENALGGAFLANGDPAAALPHLQAATAARPDYFSAHYNLGNALASLNRFPEAAQEFQEAVRLEPSDSMARANLGAALAELGRLPEAKGQLQKALELDPKNEVASDNLREVQQRIAAQQPR